MLLLEGTGIRKGIRVRRHEARSSRKECGWLGCRVCVSNPGGKSGKKGSTKSQVSHQWVWT